MKPPIKARKKLKMYFTQPFYVAEPFTKKSGEWVTNDQLLSDVKSILDGKHDRISEDEWKFIGAIPK